MRCQPVIVKTREIFFFRNDYRDIKTSSNNLAINSFDAVDLYVVIVELILREYDVVIEACLVESFVINFRLSKCWYFV